VPSRAAVEGYARVSVPRGQVQARLGEMQLLVVVGAAIGAFVALVLGLFVARRITAPIAQMTAAAEDLRSGGYGRRVGDLPRDEIGILGDTLNRLSTEVTERIRTISRDDAQLRAVLAGMSEGVVAVDEEDRVVITNAAARRLLGITAQRPEGAKLWELARVSALETILAETRRTGREARADVVIAREGKETKLEVHGSPIPPPSRGVVIVLTDVTDLRRLESMRRDFVANVSHELKTPLTSIRGYVETLLEGAIDDSENNVRFLEKVDDHVRRLTHLVTDLLTLARIESEESLPVERVDLGGVVGDSFARHEASARGKDIRCHEDIEGTVEVLGDREALVQVVDNLLTNAIKYTPPGGTVTLRTRTNGRMGVLEVLDTGIGIPAKDLDRIFERFYRVDKARSRALGGTGLGLAIVKHLVQRMDGKVSVQSEYGAGTRFTVEVPLA
jgi:two-component system phosphate regulon sensor histidine kinase PhoR